MILTNLEHKDHFVKLALKGLNPYSGTNSFLWFKLQISSLLKAKEKETRSLFLQIDLYEDFLPVLYDRHKFHLHRFEYTGKLVMMEPPSSTVFIIEFLWEGYRLWWHSNQFNFLKCSVPCKVFLNFPTLLQNCKKL